MTFDAPVTVTGDPTFAFDLGGATTATYYAGSGTTSAAVLPRREWRDKRRPGHERDFLGRERDCAQRRHHRGDRQRGLSGFPNAILGPFGVFRGRSRAGRAEGSWGLGGRNRAVRSRRRPGRQGVGDRHGVCVRTGRPRRRGRGSSESPAPLRGREANARPRHAGLPGPAGRHRAAGPGRARAGPDRDLERHPHPPGLGLWRPRLQLHRDQHRGSVQQHRRPLRQRLHARLH